MLLGEMAPPSDVGGGSDEGLTERTDPPMLATELKLQVEKHLGRFRESNPLLLHARNGSLSHRQFVDYLNNLMYFFHHSVLHLDIARTRARELGNEAVVPFLEEKIREERGHDLWAKNDLRTTGSAQEGFDLGRVAPGTHRILAYSVDLIEREPELFLAYMFFHEYMTVIGGPELVADLETRCGIPREQITSITRHVDLDRHHVEEDLEEIEKVVARSPHKAPWLRATIDETAALADDFYGGMVSLYY
jgi:hypothetical protein